MSERVVSLNDRGRGLEWLSLGFGIWLIGSLLFALIAANAATRIGADGYVTTDMQLTLLACIVHLVAGGVIALGTALLIRSGAWLSSAFAMAALLVALVERTLLAPWIAMQGGHGSLDPAFAWSAGSFAELVLVASIVLAVREVASREGSAFPLSVVGVAIAAEIARLCLVATFPADQRSLHHDPMLPWVRAALIAVASAASVGIVLLAIRSASAAVAGQIWAGDLGVTSPARAGDWQRTARGLDRFGAFLIGKIAIASAAIPLMIISVLVGLGAFSAVRVYLVPAASALASAGMAAGLFACRRVPDPPDARAGFTGAALLIAACLVADLYLLAARAGEPLAEAISSLGHLVAYLALLRSVGRIAERLGDGDLTRRARALGRLAIVTVPGATISGFLLLRYPADLAAWIAVPIAMAAVSFAALLPCALLARQLARTLRARFAEPPRAVARVG